jgi:RHS repeat-associated protein
VKLYWPESFTALDRLKGFTPQMYVGSLLDRKRNATGTEYKRNRTYDPKTGRFTQEDPIGLAGGLNLYGFANGDPVNYSDPFGLCVPWCIVAAAWAAYEIGGAAYDLYRAGKTLLDSRTSGSEKAITVGLAALSIFGPGGGYTGAVGLTSKAAAREALGELGVEGAQRSAANRAIGRATRSETIDVLMHERGDVVVRASRKGHDGHQVIESVVKPDGSKSVRQRAYDAQGRLVHDHPKTP